MKYIILNDLTYLFRKHYRIILTYLFIFILYFYVIRGTYINTQEFMFLNSVVAICVDFKFMISNPFIASMIIVNYGLFINLAIVIYKNDMENYDNFYFRISFLKWIISKIIVMFIIIFLINLVIFLNVILSKTVGFEYFIIMLKKVIITSSLISLIYLILLFYNKFKIISFLILFILVRIVLIGFDIQKISILFAIIYWVITFVITIITSKFIKFSDLKG